MSDVTTPDPHAGRCMLVILGCSGVAALRYSRSVLSESHVRSYQNTLSIHTDDFICGVG